MPARFDTAPFENAIARLPRWILFLASAGTAIAGGFFGFASAGGFLAGAIAAYLNLRIVERAVNRLARIASATAVGPDTSPETARTTDTLRAAARPLAKTNGSPY